MDNDKKEKVAGGIMLAAGALAFLYILKGAKTTTTTTAIPTTTTVPAWGSSPSYTVPESTTITTGQPSEGLMAWWAPDIWAGETSDQWRKVPVAPACQNTPLGGGCVATSFNINTGTVYALSPQYFHNVWGCWFAWPSDYSPSLDEINRLAGIGSVNKTLCQQ